MRFAASRMVSSRLLMSRCWDSAMPISLSSLRRRRRLSAESMLFDANGTYLMHIGDALQNLFNSILLQGVHAIFKADSQQLSDSCMLLNSFFDRIGSDQQFVQTHPPAIAGAGTLFATDRPIERELPLVIRKQLDPLCIQLL